MARSAAIDVLRDPRFCCFLYVLWKITVFSVIVAENGGLKGNVDEWEVIHRPASHLTDLNRGTLFADRWAVSFDTLPMIAKCDSIYALPSFAAVVLLAQVVKGALGVESDYRIVGFTLLTLELAFASMLSILQTWLLCRLINKLGALAHG